MSTPINRILVYIDGSERSWTAAQYAILLSQSIKAELFGVYIVNTQALNDLVNARVFVKSEQEEYQQELEKDSEKYLRNFARIAAERGVAAKTLKEEGGAAALIKKLTREYEIDLLVVGEISHVRSRRDELRDEVERALRAVRCSVLVVKDEERVIELMEEE